MGVNTSRVRSATRSHKAFRSSDSPCTEEVSEMLSTTIMALSTIIPTPNIKPDKEMMFMEMPSR